MLCGKEDPAYKIVAPNTAIETRRKKDGRDTEDMYTEYIGYGSIQ